MRSNRRSRRGSARPSHPASGTSTRGTSPPAQALRSPAPRRQPPPLPTSVPASRQILGGRTSAWRTYTEEWRDIVRGGGMRAWIVGLICCVSMALVPERAPGRYDVWGCRLPNGTPIPSTAGGVGAEAGGHVRDNCASRPRADGLVLPERTRLLRGGVGGVSTRRRHHDRQLHAAPRGRDQRRPGVPPLPRLLPRDSDGLPQGSMRRTASRGLAAAAAASGIFQADLSPRTSCIATGSRNDRALCAARLPTALGQVCPATTEPGNGTVRIWSSRIGLKDMLDPEFTAPPTGSLFSGQPGQRHPVRHLQGDRQGRWDQVDRAARGRRATWRPARRPGQRDLQSAVHEGRAVLAGRPADDGRRHAGACPTGRTASV